MDATLLLVLIAVVTFCVMLYGMLRSQSKKHIGAVLPGPKGWPIIGNSLQIDFKHLHVSVTDMVKTYGRIFKINLMGQTAVVISDPDILRKAYGGEQYGNVFNDRPDSFYGKYLGFDCSGIGFAKADNKATAIKRRMFHRAFKFYGDGIDHFERNAEDEIKQFLDDLENTNSRDFDLHEVLLKSFANTIVSLMTGKHAEPNDWKIIWDFIECGNQMSDPGMNFIYSIMPWIRFFPGPFGNMYRNALKSRDFFLDRFYFRLKESLNDGAMAADEHYGMVQTLLKLQREENKLAGEEIIDEKHMKGLIIDMTFASTETTTVALVDAFALLLTHPSVAKKIQAEIDSLLGSARLPRFLDKKSMPYTMATVYEVLRYTSAIGPLCLPHRVLKDQVLEGYRIPKHSLILSNLWHIHHDPERWREPWEFKPERFLDLEGDLLPPEHATRRNFLAFSTGQRDCPGETLGKSRMFLYIATVLQSFDLVAATNDELPDTDPHHYVPGATLRVKRHLCRVVPRV